jgi:hypothetical protein
MPKKTDARPYGFGNTNRRFPHAKRQKGSISKDRFAFEQTMAGNDCTKIQRGGDFVVQERNFFGDKVGEAKTFDVKSGNSRVTDVQLERQRRLGRNRHKIVRY